MVLVLPFFTTILHILLYLPSSSSSGVESGGFCTKSCGGIIHDDIPFAFGFSPGCEIQLNCTSNGTMVIHDFPIQEINQHNILVNLQAQCGRSIRTIDALFGSNYAPTSHNGILMENCSSSLGSCVLPTTMVKTHFELLNCDNQNSSNMSCYSETNNQSLFINYQNLMNSRCDYLFSAISVESFGWNLSSVSLTVQLVQLGWWVQGDCQCSKNANCTDLTPALDGKQGFRCQCLEGYVGDGYLAGSGCRRDSSNCNPAKYLSGQCGGTTRVGVLVGGIVAGAALMVGVGLICCCLRRRSKSKIRNRTRRELCEATGLINIPVYHYKEVEKATDSFSEKRRLGTGAYGAVYSGKLHNDEWVAIKRIWHRETDSIDQVINEIKLISSVSHPNLVRLLGCSIEKGEQILVYEFMPNGTLSQHLQRERGNGLQWPVRITIAAETAQAIAYLHNSVHPPIYHRDIKSSNILLDYDYKSKVADFGLSRLGMVESSHISTAPQGTPGYLDPEYHQHFHLSDKSDVYSFGVVLLEIITGLKAVDFNRPKHDINLANLGVDRIGKGCLDEIIDPFLESEKDPWTLSSIHKVAELAFRCLAFHRDMRPSMMEVAIELEQNRLSKWAVPEEINFTGTRLSSEVSSSSCSSSSSACEKPLNMTVKNNPELGKCLKASKNNSLNSPVSVQHSWPSEQSSPSSNSLLNHVVP
ncbi:OLC1v1017832C1 [Oldenlandia corymbosa var. corymbosa]|uniref:OLC1v1017832C1 n=1 Tax=Oldenlandia corymbosa var. corymbosa TaxID=529605 RepID=A0AAV1EAG0_OLDCO|nr:OLC1v1017832C1 [Oldenlandia corymbosa var. corymbosa]